MNQDLDMFKQARHDASEEASVLGRVTALLDLGRPREAAAELQRGLAHLPEDSTFWYLLSFVHTELEGYPQALHAAQQAVKFDPQSGQAQRALGLALWNTQVMGRSVRSLRRRGLGNSVFGKAGRVTWPALAALHEALRLDPEDASARIVLSDFLMQIGQLAQARTHLEAALQRQPQHQAAQLGMANLALRLRQPAEAEQRALQVLALDPLSSEALHVRARAQLHLGQPDQAFRTALAAVKLDPASTYAQMQFTELLDEYLPQPATQFLLLNVAVVSVRNAYRRTKLSPEVRVQLEQVRRTELPVTKRPLVRVAIFVMVALALVLWGLAGGDPNTAKALLFIWIIWMVIRRRRSKS